MRSHGDAFSVTPVLTRSAVWLLAFCRAVGVVPGQAVMVGDSPHDLVAGRAAGMVTVGVLTGPNGADALKPHADCILPDIGHLPDWLFR